MMFKPYTVQKCKELISECKRIMREIKEDLFNETYIPHRQYLKMQLEFGENEIRSLNRQMEFAEEYYN